MMTIECAISKAFKRCAHLTNIIEANESSWQCMDGKHRNEMGMLRALMMNAGVPHDGLPEMPFVEPAHLDAFLKRQAEWNAKKAAESCNSVEIAV